MLEIIACFQSAQKVVTKSNLPCLKSYAMILSLKRGGEKEREIMVREMLRIHSIELRAMKLSMGALRTKPLAKWKLFIPLDNNRLNFSRLIHKNATVKRLQEPRRFVFLPSFVSVLPREAIILDQFKIFGHANREKNIALIILWSILSRSSTVIKPRSEMSSGSPAQLRSPSREQRRKWDFLGYCNDYRFPLGNCGWWAWRCKCWLRIEWAWMVITLSTFLFTFSQGSSNFSSN